jgi:hypothetical protein
MVFLPCVSFALAHITQVQVAIPIQYRRPSKIMAVFDTKNGRGVAPMAIIIPDDADGWLLVSGSRKDVDDLKKVIALVDIPRQRAALSIDVQAPTDKVHYKQTVELYGGQSWSSQDTDLGLKISIYAETSLGPNLTLSVITEYHRQTAQARFRLKPGVSAVQTFGKMQVDDPMPGVHPIEQSPIITFKFTGLHGE